MPDHILHLYFARMERSEGSEKIHVFVFAFQLLPRFPGHITASAARCRETFGWYYDKAKQSASCSAVRFGWSVG